MKWISIKEEIPPRYQMVLMVKIIKSQKDTRPLGGFEGNRIYIGRRSPTVAAIFDSSLSEEDDEYEVVSIETQHHFFGKFVPSHWCPLPELPLKEE